MTMDIDGSDMCSKAECLEFCGPFKSVACWSCLLVLPIAAAIAYFVMAATDVGELGVLAAVICVALGTFALAIGIGACAIRHRPRSGRCVRRGNRLLLRLCCPCASMCESES